MLICCEFLSFYQQFSFRSWGGNVSNNKVVCMIQAETILRYISLRFKVGVKSKRSLGAVIVCTCTYISFI